MQHKFQEARPVWADSKKRYNQFLGFYTRLELEEEQVIMLEIGARSYYRLYINGEFVANGPARTAKGYCRIDKTKRKLQGGTDIAVEVTAYDKPGKYCNDCTLEPGLLILEIKDEEGKVLAASGKNVRVMELDCRKTEVETMSHSRGILEWQVLTPESFAWRFGRGEFSEPKVLEENVTYLERRAPYPDYHPIPLQRLSGICDMEKGKGQGAGFVLTLARGFNADWYEQIPEENQFLESLRNLKEQPFSGVYSLSGDGKVSIQPGAGHTAVTFERIESELGFIDFSITASDACILDIVNTDHLDMYGRFKANTYVTRYELAPGSYHLTTMEPKLVRYLRMMIQTKGEVEVTYPVLLDDSYPDREQTFFSCSDGDLNRIYEGAKRTLRLSTLDIFMDCPQRERGGWLCDSFFSAEAMWRLFGSLEVEKDFIENYMLTDESILWKGFFPEVYPSSKKDVTDPGFINWSYWLIAELYEYYQRSGDEEFIQKVQKRVEAFLDGLLSLRGESGLIETDKNLFVDWSLANRSFCTGPINIPNNCLAVYILERMAELYGKEEWKTAAGQMRSIIENLDSEVSLFGGGGDSATWKDGKLSRNDAATEGGIALELWSGFHRKDDLYLRKFIQTMGPAPEFRSNPNVGQANLFIGLMIRFDLLARMGKAETLLDELKSVYLEELRVGSGTFFENINALSGCHGFNGMAGAFLVSQVLGFKQVLEEDKEIVISPNPAGLRWARGNIMTRDGLAMMEWGCDDYAHTMNIMVQKPEGWTVRLEQPLSLSGWKIEFNER